MRRALMAGVVSTLIVLTAAPAAAHTGHGPEVVAGSPATATVVIVALVQGLLVAAWLAGRVRRVWLRR